MIFPPLFAFFGKTRPADSGHDSLFRGWFGGTVVRVFGVGEAEDVVEDQGRDGGRRGHPQRVVEMGADRGHLPTLCHSRWQIVV